MEKKILHILLVIPAGGLAATIINFAVAQCRRLLNDAPGFAPFKFLPIASGSFTGTVLAGVLYFVLQLVFEQPQIVFIVIAFAGLLASFHLPFRLTNHRSARFAGERGGFS